MPPVPIAAAWPGPHCCRRRYHIHAHDFGTLSCVVVWTAELRQYFGQFGKITSAQVMYNRETCKSRGFGFVIFEDSASLDRALQTRIHTIDEKAVRCSVDV